MYFRNTRSIKQQNIISTNNDASNKSKIVDENSIEIQQKRVANTISISKKKLKLSDEEKNMNGAPTGDIFEVVVLDDDDIKPLNSNASTINSFDSNGSTTAVNTILKKEILDILKLSCDKNLSNITTWADKYEAIELIRRIILHHYNNMNYEMNLNIENTNNDNKLSDQELLVYMELIIKATINAVESLRSGIIRNGLLLANSLMKNCVSILNENQLILLISTLFNRMSSGPRFIVESTDQILTNALSIEIISSPILAIKSILLSTNHRHVDVASKAFILLSDRCLSLSLNELSKFITENQSQIQSVDNLFFNNLIEALSRGLSSKRPLAREHTRNALSHLNKLIGDEIFLKLINCILINKFKVDEIIREISKTSNINQSSMECNMIMKEDFVDEEKINTMSSSVFNFMNVNNDSYLDSSTLSNKTINISNNNSSNSSSSNISSNNRIEQKTNKMYNNTNSAKNIKTDNVKKISIRDQMKLKSKLIQPGSKKKNEPFQILEI